MLFFKFQFINVVIILLLQFIIIYKNLIVLSFKTPKCLGRLGFAQVPCGFTTMKIGRRSIKDDAWF